MAFALIAGTALACVGRLTWLAAQLLSGASWVAISPAFDAAGSGRSLTGGAFTIEQGAMGQLGVTAMGGGSFSLVPGIIAAQPQAQYSLAGAHAFPVPFKPSLGHTRITFRGLTSNATVRIYTISGELVQTLTKNDPSTGDLVWFPVSNSAGQPVASGVYPYVIKGDSDKKLGKLMIIK